MFGAGQNVSVGVSSSKLEHRALMRDSKRTLHKKQKTHSAVSEPQHRPIDPPLRHVLWRVIAITGTMFLIEAAAGYLSGSHALQADALDFLDDTLAYGLALTIVGIRNRNRAIAEFLKEIGLCVAGLWVLGTSVCHLSASEVPRADIMGATGLLALVANAICLAMLARYRSGTENAHAAWLHSRNDILGNVVVILTAAAVVGLQSHWPDLLVAIIAAVAFLNPVIRRLHKSIDENRKRKQ